ncbi:MAG TPA: hypothetical protein VFR55_07365, partial [Dehalococcoidia bacterium]|nr:hypothetical protein [Dehalococcoidia bacterium]
HASGCMWKCHVETLSRWCSRQSAQDGFVAEALVESREITFVAPAQAEAQALPRVDDETPLDSGPGRNGAARTPAVFV